MAAQRKGRTAPAARQSYLEVVGTGERILVPDDPEGERRAVVAHPAFQRMVASAQRAQAEGRTRPIEQIFAELEAVEGYFAKHQPRRNQSTGAGQSW